jgi:hypothetical protein
MERGYPAMLAGDQLNSMNYELEKSASALQSRIKDLVEGYSEVSQFEKQVGLGVGMGVDFSSAMRQRELEDIISSCQHAGSIPHSKTPVSGGPERSSVGRRGGGGRGDDADVDDLFERLNRIKSEKLEIDHELGGVAYVSTSKKRHPVSKNRARKPPSSQDPGLLRPSSYAFGLDWEAGSAYEHESTLPSTTDSENEASSFNVARRPRVGDVPRQSTRRPNNPVLPNKFTGQPKPKSRSGRRAMEAQRAKMEALSKGQSLHKKKAAPKVDLAMGDIFSLDSPPISPETEKPRAKHSDSENTPATTKEQVAAPVVSMAVQTEKDDEEPDDAMSQRPVYTVRTVSTHVLPGQKMKADRASSSRVRHRAARPRDINLGYEEDLHQAGGHVPYQKETRSHTDWIDEARSFKHPVRVDPASWLANSRPLHVVVNSHKSHGDIARGQRGIPTEAEMQEQVMEWLPSHALAKIIASESAAQPGENEGLAEETVAERLNRRAGAEIASVFRDLGESVDGELVQDIGRKLMLQQATEAAAVALDHAKLTEDDAWRVGLWGGEQTMISWQNRTDMTQGDAGCDVSSSPLCEEDASGDPGAHFSRENCLELVVQLLLSTVEDPFDGPGVGPEPGHAAAEERTVGVLESAAPVLLPEAQAPKDSQSATTEDAPPAVAESKPSAAETEPPPAVAQGSRPSFLSTRLSAFLPVFLLDQAQRFFCPSATAVALPFPILANKCLLTDFFGPTACN